MPLKICLLVDLKKRFGCPSLRSCAEPYLEKQETSTITTGTPLILDNHERVCAVFKIINSDLAPKSIKELIRHRNSNYDLRGNGILKLPRANTTTYDLRHQNYGTQHLIHIE